MKRNFPDVKLVELPDNTGFTGGNAAGLKATDGEFVALVNKNEDGRWLEKLIQPMSQDARVGICASKLFFEGGAQINSAADGLTTAAVGLARRAGFMTIRSSFLAPAVRPCCTAANARRERILG